MSCRPRQSSGVRVAAAVIDMACAITCSVDTNNAAGNVAGKDERPQSLAKPDDAHGCLGTLGVC